MLFKILMPNHMIDNKVQITIIFNKIILFALNEQHGRMCSVLQQRYRKCVGILYCIVMKSQNFTFLIGNFLD